jgi:hypothetical protein
MPIISAEKLARTSGSGVLVAVWVGAGAEVGVRVGVSVQVGVSVGAEVDVIVGVWLEVGTAVAVNVGAKAAFVWIDVSGVAVGLDPQAERANTHTTTTAAENVTRNARISASKFPRSIHTVDQV